MGEDKRITKYVDEAMYTAEPIDTSAGPQVHLVSMTSDPLASVAIFSAMYEGKVKRSAADVTDDERAYYLQQMMKTKLKAPLETIHFHFMFEGVTRAFTHQHVRQRTAVYSQESMRFAVKETMPVGLPPSLQGTLGLLEWGQKHFGLRDNVTAEEWQAAFDRELSDEQKNRLDWDEAVHTVEVAYNRMIARGMPAEEARGLAPTNVLTRINYDTNLRNLLDHAGNRLCTQAQFEWRQVLSGVVQAIREHYIYDTRYIKMQDEWDPYSLSQDEEEYARRTESIRREYAAIASLLKPVCYQTGQCVFNADFDRKCSIRSRVDANHDINRPSSEWEFEYDKVDPTEVMTYNPELRTARDAHGTPKFIDAIRPEEWLLDPGAAR